MTTAPTDLSASAASTVATFAPCCDASSPAAAWLTSATYLSRAPDCRARLPAWILPIRPAPNNAASIIVRSVSAGLSMPSAALALEHPFVRRVVLEMPFPLRARHHVEVVRVVPVRHDDRMVAARHQHDVVIFDRERFVDRAVVGIDALKRESLRRLQPVIVGLLQRAFSGQVVGVVLVWRVARRVP